MEPSLDDYQEGKREVRLGDVAMLKKAKSLRNTFIDEAAERTGWTKARVASAIARCCPTDTDLHAFQKQCQNAKNYAAYFVWATKPRPS